MFLCGSCCSTTTVCAVLGVLAAAAAVVAAAFRERVPAWQAKGKRVLVTGGSSGVRHSNTILARISKRAGMHIGLACAEQLARDGAAAIALLARDPDRLAAAAAQLRQANAATKIHTVSADVSNRQAVQAACEKAVKEMGGVDAVILSAGASHPSLFVTTSEDDFERLVRVNYLGIVYALKSLVPHLLRNPSKNTRIVIISSMAGLSGVAGYTAYSGSKFALRGLAEALHMELNNSGCGVAVSLVCPPDVDTPMLAEENKHKPKECKLISEGSGLFTAQHIASDILAGMRDWRFLINSGLDGHFLSILGAGTAPLHSGAWGFLEFLTAGLLRVVSLAYRWNYNSIVKKVNEERRNGKLQDEAAKAYQQIWKQNK